MILAKDVALDDAGALDFGNIGDALGQDGVAVVCAAIFGQEADETLKKMLALVIMKVSIRRTYGKSARHDDSTKDARD